MPRADAWSAKWACEKLIANESILSAAPCGENLIRIQTRETRRTVNVATMSEHSVALNQAPSSLHETDTEFLLNIPKEAFFDGDLITFAASRPVGLGGLGDLYVAVNENEFRNYIPKEVRFILRGLRQHTAVEIVSRPNNRSYEITKRNSGVVRVMALSEYDLTADAVRSGLHKYGMCDFVLASNPNCRISQDATLAARSAGTGVLVWRQLLGALNN